MLDATMLNGKMGARPRESSCSAVAPQMCRMSDVAAGARRNYGVKHMCVVCGFNCCFKCYIL